VCVCVCENYTHTCAYAFIRTYSRQRRHPFVRLRAVQVALNSDDEYVGGKLVFATSSGFVTPPRPAGGVTVHTHRAVHGVTALVSGVRYSLYLCNTMAPTEAAANGVDLGYLESEVVAQWELIDRALPSVGCATDAELASFAAEYRRVFSRGAATAVGPAAAAELGLSLGAEIVWRVHTMHPAAYLCARADAAVTAANSALNSDEAEASTALVWGWAGIDLVVATRRQLSFMTRTAAVRPQFECAAAAASVVAEYRQFLELAGGMAAAVPTVAVDFVWHTHMQWPQRYATECVAVAGRVLDHDDEAPPSELEWAAACTVAAGGDSGMHWPW
jgi:hypothetical protein